jgi:hypothetical protein
VSQTACGRLTAYQKSPQIPKPYQNLGLTFLYQDFRSSALRFKNVAQGSMMNVDGGGGDVHAERECQLNTGEQTVQGCT